jgi:glycyl-tRNA synthetase alpha subunit
MSSELKQSLDDFQFDWNDYEEDDIDWEEIYATTQDDYEAGRYAFNSADYPTHEAAMEAMKQLIHEIVEKAEREAGAVCALDATG